MTGLALITQAVRWQHFLAPHTDNIQKAAKLPDCLLGEVTQPSKSWTAEYTQPGTLTVEGPYMTAVESHHTVCV